ncbi:phenylalanine--tRNA ligase subunit beta [Candidatus Parcubacteria bacterium]|nr:phenylalanine--tRNA ligase subunit beta [Candidatus Parcubacteria bacterium]
MKFSYNWLQSFFKKKLPKPGELAELLTMHSFEVEGIEKKGKDWVLDIDVLSNRGHDCLSHIGICREISAITGLKFTRPNFAESKNCGGQEPQTKDFIKIEVKDKNLCSRYTARVIADVKVGVSPKWIQERLIVCGLRPINNIVDAANYVMLEIGQPLHAFDFDKVLGKKIIVRRAKKGEKIVSLDDEKYDLDESILIIADNKDPLAIAGIKGGKKAEITQSTKTIVLESANFESKTIRLARQKLGLQTDASLRFEHQPDPNLTLSAINRVAELIQEITGGKIAKEVADFYPKKNIPKRIKLELDYVERLLGIKISKKDIISILKSLGLNVKEKKQVLEIEVPTFRQDISIQEDLIEEIGRIYGYEKISAILPLSSLIPPKRNLQLFWEDICKNILKELGFSEVYNYSFVSGKQLSTFHFPPSNSVKIENPVSVKQEYLRPSLIFNLLKNAKENSKNFKEIRIFELGKIFKKGKEKKMLAGAATNEFYELKGVIDSLLNGLGISNIWYDEYKPTPEDSKIAIWHPNKCAEIKIDNSEIGFLGEIHPKIVESLGIKNRVVVFDIDFEKLTRFSSEEHEYQPISFHPAAVRDLAILVPLDVKVVEILNKINIAGGKLVRDVDLFDIYEGEELPDGKKNLAFHIIYQSEEKTLPTKEIDKLHQEIINVLEQDPEWEVRK